MTDPLFKKIEQAVTMVEINHNRKITVESGPRGATVFWNKIQECIVISIKEIDMPTTDVAGIGAGIENSIKGRR